MDELLCHFQFFAPETLLAIYLKGRVPQWHPALRIIGVLSGLGYWLVASVVFGVQADIPNSTVMQASIGWAVVPVKPCCFFSACSASLPDTCKGRSFT